ncbi:alpha/beta fold hydrolase [Nonomuraea endophytica]|uniref:Pimeloyl-ACP methyl ester carboxylesterase n=1 Tax=Nonomuraea endophytica TaxID=714136 RepID=A0A7W8A5M7_9ACTN|nr:alpha/beta hydrolase [Nonomuraea endophytica]MBB5079459.1 pimeloyl-ACP methyl ester carboxylesterase [Nonomuraea endophytica]
MIVTVPGGRLAVVVREGGAATPVLFLHGLNSSADVWTAVFERLPRERALAAMDLRGHGGSTREGSFEVERQTADVLAVVNWLGWPRAHLVGSSYGGGLALAVAAAHPGRAATVTLFGTALDPAPGTLEPALNLLARIGVAGFFAAIAPEWTFAPGADPGLVAEANRVAAANSPATVARLLEAGFTADFRPAAAEVNCPVLLARGEHDRTCPHEVAAKTAAALGIEPHTVAGAGHLPMAEAPDLTAALIASSWRRR